MADEPAKIILGDTAISAVERTARRRWFGRGKDRQPLPFTHCQNCGAELTGPHCAQCGQAAIDYRRSFRHVIVDVLDSFLNWDSKFFATIGLLIAKPWRLTNEFLAGKRVRYLHPLRLYLLASILFFFAINYGAKGLRLEPGKISEKNRTAIAAAVAEKRDEIEAEIDKENLSAEERGDEESHLRSMFAHFVFGPRLQPAFERRCRFGVIENNEWPLVHGPIGSTASRWRSCCCRCRW